MRLTTPAVLTILSAAAVYAVSPAGGGMSLPHTFQAGTPARASEVNENFEALLLRIQDLELQLATVQDKTQFLTVEQGDLEGLSGPHLLVEGANLHLRSGSGTTDDGGAVTGLGNLIVGYSELEDLSPADRVGSHNLILGRANSFTSVGGLVAGTRNRISGSFATITGGRFGEASGNHASISGGGGETENLFNVASGEFSSISGGLRNIASGDQSSVLGGSNNETSGFLTAILGGTSNAATVAGSVVSGGAGNTAGAANAAISGGQGNQVTGVSASITGGLNQTVTQNFDCADCN